MCIHILICLKHQVVTCTICLCCNRINMTVCVMYVYPLSPFVVCSLMTYHGHVVVIKYQEPAVLSCDVCCLSLDTQQQQSEQAKVCPVYMYVHVLTNVHTYMAPTDGQKQQLFSTTVGITRIVMIKHGYNPCCFCDIIKHLLQIPGALEHTLFCGWCFC